MLNQAAATALRILVFRAGPQDFPYSPAVTRVTVPLMAVTAFLQYRLTLPAPQALVHAAAAVAALAAFTYVVLQVRGLTNRVRQTIDSLFAVDTMMTVLLLAPLAALAPHMMRIAEHPELARDTTLPALPALAVTAVSLWNFLVSANIYRHALNAHFGVGALVALLGAIITVSLASAVSALAG